MSEEGFISAKAFNSVDAARYEDLKAEVEAATKRAQEAEAKAQQERGEK